uniref:(California timema) hypothetical protein n=1 Tax=Timema californicum TaxID=61474 RepID=A0A7R9JB00_TIMCA|nr:unnamed protein product [Timema californicum]
MIYTFAENVERILVQRFTGWTKPMYFNTCMSDWVKGCCRGSRRHVYRKIVVTEETNPLLMKTDKDRYDSATDVEKHSEETKETNKDDEDEGEIMSLWVWPSEESFGKKCWWMFIWPISFLLKITIPDCRSERWKNYYLLTFTMCILWIGSTSYTVAWMITVIGRSTSYIVTCTTPAIGRSTSYIVTCTTTVMGRSTSYIVTCTTTAIGRSTSYIVTCTTTAIGDTLGIPDSVVGITFLAAGTSVPEAVSSVIVTNQGELSNQGAE